MLFAFIQFVLSAVLFWSAPNHYSAEYCGWILAIFAVSSLWFIRRSLHGNYLNFHLLFFISFFFVNFAYPVFIYPTDPFHFSVFGFPFNHDIISKSTALALLGASAYILGGAWMQARKIASLPRSEDECEWLAKINRILTPAAYLSVVLFLAVVGRGFFQGLFMSYNEGANHLLIGFQTLFVLALILSFLARQNSFKGTLLDFLGQYSKTTLVFIGLTVMIFFYVGDRGPALQILFVLGALYSLYVKAIRFKLFLAASLLGMFVLTFISYARSADPGYGKSQTSLVDYFARGKEQMQLDSIVDLGRDLIVNNRNLYFAVDYADRNGVNYGKTMIVPIISVIPGAGSLSKSLFHIDVSRMTSGRMITDLTFGERAGYGLGNAIIGDIYMSWGVIGVIVFMIVFGYINTKFQIYAMATNNLYYVVAYVISISYAVYYARSSYFIALRAILWPILIVMFLRLVFPQKREMAQEE